MESLVGMVSVSGSDSGIGTMLDSVLDGCELGGERGVNNRSP